MPTEVQVPTDRIVKVSMEGGGHLWACGPWRGSVARRALNASNWEWRVWNVLGPVTDSRGVLPTLWKAEHAVLSRMKELAGVTRAESSAAARGRLHPWGREAALGKARKQTSVS